MMDGPTVWVDVIRCTGCGACVEVCPVGAIALVDGKARVDEELCTGCGACVDACPESAIPMASVDASVARVPQSFVATTGLRKISVKRLLF